MLRIVDVDERRCIVAGERQQASAQGGLTLVVSKVMPAVTDGRFRVELNFRGTPPAALDRGQALDARTTLGAPRLAVVAPVGG